MYLNLLLSGALNKRNVQVDVFLIFSQKHILSRAIGIWPHCEKVNIQEARIKEPGEPTSLSVDLDYDVIFDSRKTIFGKVCKEISWSD